MNVTARFADDITSSIIGVAGLAAAITPIGWLAQGTGLNDYVGEASGLYTEEDLKRRKDQDLLQNLFDNPLTQYANNIMDTHVYNPEDQVKMLEEGLSDNQLYKTVE